MKNGLLKVVSIVLLVAIMVMAFVLPTYATVNGNGFGVTFQATDNSGASKSVQNIIGAIIYIAQIIGIGVAIIMLIVLAIKYIAASPNDKAEIKKHIVVYVVGAILLFSAAGILEIIKKFAMTNIKAGT